MTQPIVIIGIPSAKCQNRLKFKTDSEKIALLCHKCSLWDSAMSFGDVVRKLRVMLRLCFRERTCMAVFLRRVNRCMVNKTNQRSAVHNHRPVLQIFARVSKAQRHVVTGQQLAPPFHVINKMPYLPSPKCPDLLLF